jgi:hypothetical protein
MLTSSKNYEVKVLQDLGFDDSDAEGWSLHGELEELHRFEIKNHEVLIFGVFELHGDDWRSLGI